MTERGGVQSVQRALDLLESIAAAGGAAPLAELAKVTGLPPATLHRLAATLVDRGWLRRLPDRGYALGFRPVPLGATAHQHLGGQAETVLSGLVEQLGETANLAMRSGDSVEYVAQVPSTHRMRMFTEVGRRSPLHSTGVGKALLAGCPDDEVAGVLERVGMPVDTEHTLSTPEELFADLAMIRERGWALDDEEQELGVRCVAVAVFRPDQVVPAANLALSVSGPISRMEGRIAQQAAKALREAAETLASTLLQQRA